MHAYRSGQGAARARVLYFFRSPPNVQIGRKLLDAEVREALEHTHPDLAFDWAGLLREPMPPARPDPRERGPRQRSQARKERSTRQKGKGPAEAAPAVAPDDESLLGRTVGGAEAARLRARHAELSLRIVRRARTPEERDRLLEALTTLNPDDWPDEASIRSRLAEIDAQWDALAGELPRRRRGRRGGRSREDGGGTEEAHRGGADQAASSDVIIQRHHESDDRDSPVDPGARAPDPPPESLAVADGAVAPDGGDDQRPAGASPGGVGTGDDPETDVR